MIAIFRKLAKYAIIRVSYNRGEYASQVFFRKMLPSCCYCRSPESNVGSFLVPFWSSQTACFHTDLNQSAFCFNLLFFYYYQYPQQNLNLILYRPWFFNIHLIYFIFSLSRFSWSNPGYYDLVSIILFLLYGSTGILTVTKLSVAISIFIYVE